MKRLLPGLCLFFLASSALAFQPNAGSGNRIGVLRMQHDWDRRDESAVADGVTRGLREELRQRGFDAFDTRMTIDDVRHSERAIDADFLVEIASSSDAGSVGGVDVGGADFGVEMSVVVARVAAQLRVYDGRTLELIQTFDLHKSSTAVLPTAIGIGGRHAYGWIALPFVHWAQLRSAARATARDAAARVAEATQPR